MDDYRNSLTIKFCADLFPDMPSFLRDHVTRRKCWWTKQQRIFSPQNLHEKTLIPSEVKRFCICPPPWPPWSHLNMKNKGLLRLLYIRCNTAYTTCQQYKNNLQVRRSSLEIKKSTKTALFQSLLTLSILHGLALEVTTKREAMFSRRRCKQNAILLLACVALFVLFKWLFVSKIFGKNEKCLVYSPAYPSAGGPGCSPRCVEKEGKKTAMYGAVFHGDSHQTWPKDLVENMKLAGTILKKHGRPKTLNTEGRLVLHLAFDYYCCYTEEEGIKIGNFLNTYSWEPH